MEITFTLNGDDASHASNYLVTGGKPGTRRVMIAYIALLFFCMVFAAVISLLKMARHPHIDPMAVFISLGPIVIFVIAFPLSRARSRRAAAQLSFTQTIKLLPDRIVQVGNDMEQTYLWRSVLDVASDKHGIYVKVSQNMVLMIPERAFPDADERERFVSKARTQWERHRFDDVIRPTVASPVHSVTYRLEREDLIFAHRLWVRPLLKEPSGKRFRIAIGFILTAIVIAFAFLDARSGLMNTLPVVGPPALILALFLYFMFSPTNTLAQAKADPAICQPMTIGLTPEHFVHASTAGEIQIPWSGIRAIHVYPQAIQFEQAVGHGYLIPRRAFLSPEDLDTFAAAARAYHAGQSEPELTSPVWPPPPSDQAAS